MSLSKSACAGIIALIFPVLVLGGLWAKAISARHIGQEIWQIKMTGYDPRDLLYGHYLRFRYDWNIPADFPSPAGNTGKSETCMCLNRSDQGTRNPEARPMHCDSPETKRCESAIRVFRAGSSYTLTRGAASERYFIPEEKAAEIDRLFQQENMPFYMELMAHKNGKVSLRGLYVGEQKIEDYLRQTARKSGQ